MRLIENYCQQARDLIAKSFLIINRRIKTVDAIVIIEVRRKTREREFEWIFFMKG